MSIKDVAQYLLNPMKRIRELEQQRAAELLEALKLIKDHPSNDAYEIRQYAVAAINRAEA